MDPFLSEEQWVAFVGIASKGLPIPRADVSYFRRTMPTDAVCDHCKQSFRPPDDPVEVSHRNSATFGVLHYALTPDFLASPTNLAYAHKDCNDAIDFACAHKDCGRKDCRLKTDRKVFRVLWYEWRVEELPTWFSKHPELRQLQQAWGQFKANIPGALPVEPPKEPTRVYDDLVVPPSPPIFTSRPPKVREIVSSPSRPPEFTPSIRSKPEIVSSPPPPLVLMPRPRKRREEPYCPQRREGGD